MAKQKPVTQGGNRPTPARTSERTGRDAPRTGGTADAIRGPLPEGAVPEDYVGGRRPHKTKQKETKSGTPGAAGGKRNEVI
jgi:hypothetical protein